MELMFLCDGHQNTFAVELLVVVTLSVKNRFILALLVTICLHYCTTLRLLDNFRISEETKCHIKITEVEYSKEE